MKIKEGKLSFSNENVDGQFQPHDTTKFFDTQSIIDRMFGCHTRSFIVAILFIITLVCFTIYFLSFKGGLSNTITTGFLSLLSGLAGFFVASLK